MVLEQTKNKVLAVAIAADSGADTEELLKTIQNARKFSGEVFVLGIDSTAEALAVIEQEGLQERFVSVSLCADRGLACNKLIDFIEKNSSADYLLWLNAGEVFDSTIWEEFEFFLQNEAESNSLYVQILRRFANEFANGKVQRNDFDEETIDARLLPLNKGLYFTGKVKESLYTSAEKLMVRLSAAPGRILCPPKYADSRTRKIRGAKNLQFLEMLIAQGTKVSEEVLLFRAEIFLDLGDYPRAVQDLQQLAREAASKNIRLTAYYLLWDAMKGSNTRPDAITKVLLEALDGFPVDLQLLTLMGKHLQSTGRQDIARRTFGTALQYGHISLDVWHLLHIREVAVVSLALIERLDGNNAAAIKILEDNFDKIEFPSDYVRYLFDLYISETNELKAHRAAERVWNGEELDLIQDVLTGACRAAAGSPEAAVLPLEGAYNDGCRDILCLRWYAMTLIALNRFDDAVPVLEEWCAAAPNSGEAKTYLEGAKNPERFAVVLEKLRRSQNAFLNSLHSGENGNPAVSPARAVSEMVAASASPSKGISTSSFGKPADKTFEIEIGGEETATAGK
ncbi:hypothetical protein FACS189427_01630 [Planctomycetales bacterium]|nr:hypothetical protein FACS189427_01630 [Planctomycetales bacterium]